VGHDLSAATARASLLYDIENDIVADAKLGPLAVDERSLAEEHIEALLRLEKVLRKEKTIVIFDRGYPSRELIKHLQGEGLKYVMRVRRGFNPQIDEQETGSGIVRLCEGIDVRVLAFTLSGGGREALITNLTEDEVEDAAFPELYHKRWPVETKYCQLKQKLELENFSGRLVDNIKQDFYAMMTVSNMLASCMREANRRVKKETGEKGNLYEYRANVNHAVGVLKDRLIGVLIADGRLERNYLYRQLVSEIKWRVVPLRPNREVPRKGYLKKPHFHHNHKSNC
jgi:hypothetical protein